MRLAARLVRTASRRVATPTAARFAALRPAAAAPVRVTAARAVATAAASVPRRAMSSANQSTASVSHDGSARRKGDEYVLTKEEIAAYHRDGYLLAPGIVSAEELAQIERVYAMFLDRQIHVPGKDFCDMSKPLSTKFEDYSLINAMLPRVYYPPLRDNVFERRTASLARQLFPDVEMVLDYDQFLAKKPSKGDAVFAWHQDMAYWPPTADTRTATFSLAVDPSMPVNGCLKVVPGSHLEPAIRRHYPMGNAATRDEAHTLVTDVDERSEPIVTLPVPKGGFTIHNERIAHASGGNTSTMWRRTYVIAYRTRKTVEWERAHGFTHSHNDTFNWDAFNKWQAKPNAKPAAK